MFSKKVREILNWTHYRVFYFVFYCGYIPFLLYFPLYLKHIGLNAFQVGIISGVRPLFQGLATPLLISISDRLNSRKILFICSSVIAILKILGLFLFLRPSKQRCVMNSVKYTNNTRIQVKRSYVIEHKLSKRAVMLRWPTDTWQSGNLAARTGEDRKESYLVKTLQSMAFKNRDTRNFLHSAENKRGNKTFSVEHNLVITNSSIANTTTRDVVEYTVSNDEEEVAILFYSALIVALISDMFDAALFTLVDHSCLKNKGQNYGLTRLSGTIGWGLMSPIVAIVIHENQREVCGKMTDAYHYIFIFALVISNISLLIGSHLTLDGNFANYKIKKIGSPRSNFQYGILLMIFSFAGFCNGFLLSFVNWFIDSLGGNAIIMGLATLCKSVTDVLLFFLLRKLVEFAGFSSIISIGLVGHIAVFVVYYLVSNPWIVIAIEVFHTLFYGFLVSTCSYILDLYIPAGADFQLQSKYCSLKKSCLKTCMF